MTISETAIFEALNAKKLTPQEVAASFVIPPQYEQLVGPDHSLLIGPRGSGKTTLLRMLQGEALVSWRGERAEAYRNRVRYSSVFLPADRLWESQVPNAGNDDPLGVAAFCTQLLYALVDTMLYRLGENSDSSEVHLPAHIDIASEGELVQECAEAWRIKLRTKSLFGLQGALDLRLNEIATAIETRNGLRSWNDDWVRIRPLESFRFGISAFNRHTRQRHHRWALLLDEMELAPESVHRSLRNSLRGGQSEIILKLSFSPSDRYALTTTGLASATPDNDFRPIYLWYGTRSGSRRFSYGLWDRMMLESTGESHSVVRVLGTSEIDASGATWRDQAYRPNSKQFRLMKKMESQDSDFARYLREQAINLDQIEKLSYERRSATLRKVYPLLVFREAVLRFDGGRGRRRTRKKVTECYTGADAVIASLEGNPRWVKAVLSKLIASTDRNLRVNRGLQYDTLREAAERFESLLRLLPYNGPSSSDTVLTLLDEIAAYFSDRAFGKFTPEPAATFTVDSKVPAQVVDALTLALSAGAVVHLRSKTSPVILPSLVGERFRLTYLLATRDGLEFPLRLGKAVSLSSILEWSQRRRAATPRSRRRYQHQTLWSMEESP